MHHSLPDGPLGLSVLVRRVEVAHLDLCDVRIPASPRFLSGHEGLEVFDDLPGADVDALEDVHLGRDRTLCRRVADNVDEDVVVQLLRVGAGEGRGFANQTERKAFNSFLENLIFGNLGTFLVIIHHLRTDHK